MTATALSLPFTADIPVQISSDLLQTWIRRVLLLTLLVAGGLLTVYILSHLGPVVYGLPAPFFRRAVAADAQAV
jgi:hypothetical protein